MALVSGFGSRVSSVELAVDSSSWLWALATAPQFLWLASRLIVLLASTVFSTGVSFANIAVDIPSWLESSLAAADHLVLTSQLISLLGLAMVWPTPGQILVSSLQN